VCGADPWQVRPSRGIWEPRSRGEVRHNSRSHGAKPLAEARRALQGRKKSLETTSYSSTSTDISLLRPALRPARPLDPPRKPARGTLSSADWRWPNRACRW